MSIKSARINAQCQFECTVMNAVISACIETPTKRHGSADGPDRHKPVPKAVVQSSATLGMHLGLPGSPDPPHPDLESFSAPNRNPITPASK
jgi:hypothetical protein